MKVPILAAILCRSQTLASLAHPIASLQPIKPQNHHRRSITSAATATTINAATKNVCIVGAGPAGLYAAQYLVKHLPDVRIDLLEKLPVPFGLVRFGVAPDHPEVKNVINTFTKTAEHPNVRFLGNLALGRDYSVADLRERYHAVILAYGAEHDRRLNIPNETADTVLSAREFVAWYNGLPGSSERFDPHLDRHRSVAIVGQGNVAVDVARILLSPVDALQQTDITAHALEALRSSTVQRVHLVGRRGPLQAAFTIKELREMTKLPAVRCDWRTDDFVGIAAELAQLQRPRRRLTELMLSSMNAAAATDASRADGGDGGGGDKEFCPLFMRSPVAIESGNRLRLAVNRLVGQRAEPTEHTELLDCDLVMRSIGYKAVNVDASVNFDGDAGHVRQHGGRVLRPIASGSDHTSIDGIEDRYERGLYAAGWLATGPTGVILTTMNAAFGVAQAVCEDFAAGRLSNVAADDSLGSTRQGLDDRWLRERRVVRWDGWQRIDRAEVEAARGTSKPREKIVDVERMLAISTFE